MLPGAVEAALPEAVREHADARRLLAALLGANIGIKDAAAIATVEFGGVTPAVLRSIVEAWFAE